jgi:release factor glutamine methyltransferase
MKFYQAALAETAATLQQAGIDQPRREARLLLAHILGVPSNALPPPNTPVDHQALQAAVARRAAHEPLAYITGTQGFWTFEVAVSPATLIPRPDSETLIEAAIAARPNRAAVTSVLDVGTGTGCLLLAALVEFPAAIGIGTDRVPQAAALAAANAARLGLTHRAHFLAADWAAPLRARFDLILSNPPYITTNDIPGLMRGVREHEPVTALDGGATGLAAYAHLIPAVKHLLKPGGLAIMELGAGQFPATAHLAIQAGFTQIEARADLAGITRALLLHAPD